MTHPFSPLPSTANLVRVVACQGAAALEAAATGHALWALLTAEQIRLNYCEAANEHTSPSMGSEAASNQRSQPTDRGSAHVRRKQSAKGRTDSAASADREGTWQHCMEHAHEAVQAWQRCLHAHAAEGDCSDEGLADEATLLQLMLELLYMAGLHGETYVYALPFAIIFPLLVPLLSLYCSLPLCAFHVHAWLLPRTSSMVQKVYTSALLLQKGLLCVQQLHMIQAVDYFVSLLQVQVVPGPTLR